VKREYAARACRAHGDSKTAVVTVTRYQTSAPGRNGPKAHGV